jgi:hypothetical protein
MPTDLDTMTTPYVRDAGVEINDPANAWPLAPARILLQLVSLVGGVCQIGHDPETSQYWIRVLRYSGGGWLPWQELKEEQPPVPPLVVGSLAPAQATIGDPDFTLFVIGQGFTESSVIFFAGNEEPTTLNGDGTLSTAVKPSLWGAPVVVQCSVRNGSVSSNEIDFEFLAPVTRAPRA